MCRLPEEFQNRPSFFALATDLHWQEQTPATLQGDWEVDGMGLPIRKKFRSRFGIIMGAVFYAAVIACLCYATINLFTMWTNEYTVGEPRQRSVR